MAPDAKIGLFKRENVIIGNDSNQGVNRFKTMDFAV